jgi:beta-phosphoglucomutase
MKSIFEYLEKHNIKALLFDLNGTMIDDIGYHIDTWQKIINEMGKPFSCEDSKRECYGRNEELIERVFPGQYSLEERLKLGGEKEERYRVEFLPHLKLIDGLEKFLQEAQKRGLLLAIGSAAIVVNIDYVLDNCKIRQYFQTIVSGEDVSNSKPDPEVFIKCAENLNVLPHQCLVFEDVPKGVEAAVNAGMKSVVLKTTHIESDFDNLKEEIVFYADHYL